MKVMVHSMFDDGETVKFYSPKDDTFITASIVKTRYDNKNFYYLVECNDLTRAWIPESNLIRVGEYK